RANSPAPVATALEWDGIWHSPSMVPGSGTVSGMSLGAEAESGTDGRNAGAARPISRCKDRGRLPDLGMTIVDAARHRKAGRKVLHRIWAGKAASHRKGRSRRTEHRPPARRRRECRAAAMRQRYTHLGSDGPHPAVATSVGTGEGEIDRSS